MHDLSVAIPRCNNDVYVNSFVPRIARLGNSLPAKCFPLTDDLNGSVLLSSIVVEVIRTVFFYQDILHKKKTPKYLNMPKKHNKAHKLGDICPDKTAEKKNNQ